MARPSTAVASRPAGAVHRVPPTAYFVVSSVFHYLGPSLAVLLFARMDVLGVAWLRIATAAVVLAAWRHPRRAFRALDLHGRLLVVSLGVVLAVMNACFYLAIDRLPLATVAAIEFVGPVLLALLGARSPRNVAAVVAAATGVYFLTHVVFVGQPFAVFLAFANAALFTAYIVLAHRLSRTAQVNGIDALAAAMVIALVAVSPLAAQHAAVALLDPVVLGAGVGVGVASSVVPYVFDQLAMARLPRPTYALLIALLPAVATVVGALVLVQLPSLVDLAGIGLVMAAIALHHPGEKP